MGNGTPSLEQIYKKVFDKANDLIFVYPVDTNGDSGPFIDVNRACVDLLGYSKAEFRKLAPIDLIYAAEEQEVKDSLRKLIAERTAMSDLAVIAKDGRKIPVEVSSHAFRLNSVDVVVSIARDVTEKRKVEKTLQESERLYRAIVEDQTEFLTRYTKDTTLTYVNDAVCKWMGMTADELIGQKFEKFLNPATRRDLRLALDRLTPGNPSFILEHTITLPNQEIFYLAWTNRAVFDSRGKILGYQGVGRDVTKQKLAEQELLRKNLAVDSSISGIVLADLDGNLNYVNKSFLDLYGYGDASEVLDRYAGDFWGKMYGNQRVLAALHGKGNWVGELIAKKADGSKFPVSLAANILVDEKGKPFGMMGSFVDISDRKKFEKKLIEAKEAAERSEKSKDDLLTNISHEIRTPMNAVMGLVNLLLDTELDEKQRRYVKSMKLSADNLLVIINDLLDLSRSDAKKINIREKEFDPRLLIDELLNIEAIRAEEKGLSLRKRIAGDIPELLIGDPVRLNQILLNLLTNATKYTYDGGVFLSVKCAEKKRASVVLHFAVRDTGIGIPRDKLEFIFEPFTQVEKPAQVEQTGSGLGLAITKRLVKLQGGTISVNSRVGKGSEFVVQLEYRTADGVPSGGSDGEKAHVLDDLRGYRFLLVDDNEINRMITTNLIKDVGGRVDYAVNGKEAIDMLKGKKYDLVIMDVKMPVMDGYEATRYIRKKMGLSSRKLPIIALTAYANMKERKKCRNAGMNDHITKPFTPEYLYEKIAQNV